MHLQIYYRFITVPVTAVLTIVSGITEAAAGVQGRHASTTFGDSTLHHSTALTQLNLHQDAMTKLKHVTGDTRHCTLPPALSLCSCLQVRRHLPTLHSTMWQSMHLT